MDTKKTWLEVSLNGPWGRGKQPGIPVTVKEIVERRRRVCEGRRGHRSRARLRRGDRQAEGRRRIYARIIDGIRGRVDAIVYPTIPLAGLPAIPGGQTRAAALRPHGRIWRKRGLLEWAAVDPGSVNFAYYDDLREDKPGFVYLQPRGAHPPRAGPGPPLPLPSRLRDLRARLRAAGRHAALALQLSGADLPVHVLVGLHLRLSAGRLRLDRLSDSARPGGAGRAVDDRRPGRGRIAHDPACRAWRAATYASGWRMRRWARERTNLQWVEAAAQAIDNAGGELATAADVRAVAGGARDGRRVSEGLGTRISRG